MRSTFQIAPQLNIIPIEKIQVPTNSRDQLAPILLALQWIYTTPEVSREVFEILEAKILPGKSKDKGRPGLDLWQILVLGIVRNARNCDYDQLEDLASHHTLIRQFLNLPPIAGSDLTNIPNLTHKTISNNVSHITEELLQDINRIVAKHGRTLLSKEKIFSLFEPHTQWISKGKAGCPVELGRKLLITTDQNHLVLDYQIMDDPDEHPQAPATVARILEQYGAGSIKSISFDKGFSSKANKEQLQDVAGRVIMPKKGKCNAEESAEERQAVYIKLRRAHSAVESNINSLEHHGLDRCPDKGYRGYTRYTGLGIIAYNLHQIGKGILRRAQEDKDKAARKLQRQIARAAA